MLHKRAFLQMLFVITLVTSVVAGSMIGWTTQLVWNVALTPMIVVLFANMVIPVAGRSYGSSHSWIEESFVSSRQKRRRRQRLSLEDYAWRLGKVCGAAFFAICLVGIMVWGLIYGWSPAVPASPGDAGKPVGFDQTAWGAGALLASFGVALFISMVYKLIHFRSTQG